MQPRPNPIHKKILLYGNSILIAGLACKLREAGNWEVAQMESGRIGDLSGVAVIAFDVRDKSTAESLPRLRELPGIALVGLDALTDTVTVLTGQSRPAHSLQDVQDVLDALKQAM